MAVRGVTAGTGLVERARDGDRVAVARLISLVEDGGPGAAEAAEALFPHTGRAAVVGVTGAPGAGKSTLTERLIGAARTEGARVGVLAVDPSSPYTGGAFLGDRVRMQAHATDDGVFIRSMASRGRLGGLAHAAPQAIRVLDAAGCDVVLVETVGVGQAEVDVARAADTTVVVVTPGWGDGVQAAKAGLLEIADVFVVNKADRDGAAATVRELRQTLHLGPGRAWDPPVVETVATDGTGVGELWAAVRAHGAYLRDSGELVHRRRARLADEVTAAVAGRVLESVRTAGAPLLAAVVARVERRELSPERAAVVLLEALAADARRPASRTVAP